MFTSFHTLVFDVTITSDEEIAIAIAIAWSKSDTSVMQLIINY
jgi:hypothetical protein